MNKIGIDCGHTLSGDGTGSQGCGFKEQVLTREVGKEVMRLLKLDNRTVVDCTVDKSSNQLAERVKKANNTNLDLFVSIHFNACVNDETGNGKTTGTECWVYSNTSKANAPAKRITENIAKTGLRNRGVKINPKYYVLKNTNCPGVIIEVAFIDDLDDMKIYAQNVKTIAKHIAEGIVGKTISEPIKQPGNGVYRVITGSFGDKNNAIAHQEELKRKGITSFLAYYENA